MKSIFNLLLTALVLHLSSSTAHNGPLIHTKLGDLKGNYIRVRGKTTLVHAYLSVPFAQPPVGNLRLAPPQPVQGWEGIRDATQMPPMCLQDRQLSEDLLGMAGMIVDIPEVSEDCLYLNVYTPAQPAQDAMLPVMVWIHGGGFSLGSASMTDGSVLAAYQNVVVVVIQYRLGILGFFSTGDENAPGNTGLLDQVAALQWVQENIHSFGGDPSSVTIFGESAGGVSVSLLVLSPLSTGLFHRAIAESGTATLFSVVNTNPIATAMIVANVTNCEGTKPYQIVDCVMQLSAEDIVKFTQENKQLVFGVVKDGHILPKQVADLLESHEFNKVPLINGINNHECGWLLPSFMLPPDWVDGIDRDTMKNFVDLFSVFYPDGKLSTDLILNEFIGSGEDRIKNRDSFTEFFGDIFFTIPAIMLSNAHRDSGAPVFAYEFQHPPSILAERRPSFVRADHGDEIAFVFGGCFFNSHINLNGTFTEEEVELCRTMMAYWGNFARTGSPNGPGLTHWPTYGAGEEYLGIGLKQQVGRHLKADSFNFMTQTLQEKVHEMQQQPQEQQEQQQEEQEQQRIEL
ncbi:carboxylesterase 5A-like [Clupea harengus]|uniref:Carboxylic ester hydrolase n=1 Tax=Clupea harengus TaxID=7950 RepID=A0A6P8F7X8_CLUHA|nr:carboxylesterase 5A-like [Clupea harengus]